MVFQIFSFSVTNFAPTYIRNIAYLQLAFKFNPFQKFIKTVGEGEGPLHVSPTFQFQKTQ